VVVARTFWIVVARSFDVKHEISRLSRAAGVVAKSNHLRVVAFVLVIAAPGITLFLSDSAEYIRQREYREPAGFPQLFDGHLGPIPRPSKTALLTFPKNFEIWFNDHRGLRGPLMGIHSHARLAGLVGSGMAQSSIGHKDSNGVVVGREGWLFLASDAIIHDYRRSRPMTVDELESWKQALNARRDWLAERGIEYLFVIAPNKGEIYSEYLPRAFKPVSDVCRLDQIVEYCGGEGGVKIVDLRKPLLEMKSEHQLYYKTDTHWNALGAFAGYHAIMDVIAEKLKGSPVLQLDSFQIEEGEIGVRDLGRMLGGNVTEQGLKLKPRQLPKWQTSIARTPTHKEGRVILVNNPAADRPNIVVLHDSFMGSRQEQHFQKLAGFLNEHFQRVCYECRREDRGDPFPAELIEQERPTMVIEEIVQRRLQQPPLVLPPPADVIVTAK
jgi:alginate O-acetyltransferase complex protein AlgJ